MGVGGGGVSRKQRGRERQHTHHPGYLHVSPGLLQELPELSSCVYLGALPCPTHLFPTWARMTHKNIDLSFLIHSSADGQLGCFHVLAIIRKLWYIYTMESYSAIKGNSFESVLMRWMKLESIIQSEVSQKDEDQYSILMHIYGILKDGNDNPICKTEKETQMYRTDFGTLWER